MSEQPRDAMEAVRAGLGKVSVPHPVIKCAMCNTDYFANVRNLADRDATIAAKDAEIERLTALAAQWQAKVDELNRETWTQMGQITQTTFDLNAAREDAKRMREIHRITLEAARWFASNPPGTPVPDWVDMAVNRTFLAPQENTT